MTRLATKIEAILYLKGQPLSAIEIAQLAGCDREEAEEAIIELMSDYAYRDSALEVIETPRGYSLQLRSVFENLLQVLVPAELGTGALRTLAAIALKSPILQTDLIELRGSSAYQQIQELVELGFVRKRRQASGRSYWLEVTDKFHQYFEIDEANTAAITRVRRNLDEPPQAISTDAIDSQVRAHGDVPVQELEVEANDTSPIWESEIGSPG